MSNQSAELRDKLNKEIQKVSWDALQPHAERDALILVDETLELVEVGIVAAEDCADIMNLWVEKGWLSKPSQDDRHKTKQGYAHVNPSTCVWRQLNGQTKTRPVRPGSGWPVNAVAGSASYADSERIANIE